MLSLLIIVSYQESEASTMTIREDTIFDGEKFLDDDAVLVVNNGATLTIYGTLTNFGIIENNVVINEGKISNFGILINKGYIANNHAVENNGVINNLCSGRISEPISGQPRHDGCKIWIGKEDGRWNVPDN